MWNEIIMKILLFFSFLTIVLIISVLFVWKSGEEDYFYYTIGITGENKIDCGMSKSSCESFNSVMRCANDAFNRKKSFSGYLKVDSKNTFALASSSNGELFIITPNNGTNNKKIVSNICKSTILVDDGLVQKYKCLELKNINNLVQKKCN